jgi:hypothetical protein
MHEPLERKFDATVPLNLFAALEIFRSRRIINWLEDLSMQIFGGIIKAMSSNCCTN